MFEKGSRVHLIGIKGVFMTALAGILKARGVIVTGSDIPDHFFTDDVLAKHKLSALTPFDAQNIPKDTDLIVSSGAYYFNKQAMTYNPEVLEALRRNIPIITHAEALGMLGEDYKIIAVTGSHGKSTTTALLAWILEQNGVDPTAIVGTRVNEWNSGSRVGKSEWLVTESDEYREYFLNYKPFGAIITSIDYDHPDYFKTRSSYYAAFKKLIGNIDPNGWLVVCGDDLELKSLAIYAEARGIRVVSYGFLPGNDVRLADGGIVKQKQMFNIMFGGKHDSKQLVPGGSLKKSIFKKADHLTGEIKFPGKQYILNSGAAFTAALHFGVSPQKAVKAIATFPGTARRLEVLKRSKHATIIDDYAHHPTAINITLAGIRALYPKKKIAVIFQPHMFSRTAALLKDFAQAFQYADTVGIMEIYPSAREAAGPVRGRELAAETKFYHKHVTYLKDVLTAKKYLAHEAQNGTVVVLMGAGDVNQLAKA